MRFKVLFDGYSEFKDNIYRANCSCVLVKGSPNVIIDTMTAWDDEKLLKALQEESVDCKDIEYVVCTHGHSDHIGCNHLFKHAKHIVGFSISNKDQYFTEPCFQAGEEYIISDKIRVIPTPGHTMQDVTGKLSKFYFQKDENVVQALKKLCEVYGEDCITERQCQRWFAHFPYGNFNVQDPHLVILDTEDGIVAVTGDLFEKFEDLENDQLWKLAGSDSEELQMKNRKKILKIADYIVPGHGSIFKVPQKYKNS